MSGPAEKLEQALKLHQAGDPESAIRIYKEHLSCQPEDAQAVYLLGTALLQTGEAEASLSWLNQAEGKFPHIPDIPNNIGIACQALGNWEEAEKAFCRSIQINPDYGQAYFNYGSLLYEKGQLEEAEKNLKQAARLSPIDCEVKNKYADVLKDQKKWKEAATVYQSISQLPQAPLSSMVNYAFVLVQQNRINEAIEVYAGILQKKPDYYQIYNNLGYLLERQGQFQEAMQLVNRSLEYQPDYAEGWNNLGVIYKSLYQFEEAINSFTKAIRIQPEFSLAHYNLGTTYLIQEKYPEGWEGYSHHHSLNEADQHRDQFPAWSGESIPQKKLLVYSDQGLGDAIMLIRFLEKIREQSQAELTVEVPETLISLFRNSFPEFNFIPEGDLKDSIDYCLPLSQAPVITELQITDLPLKSSYLKPAERSGSELEEVLNKKERKPRIGLCWQGNPNQSRDYVRSCPLLLLETLLDTDQFDWFSFQVDEASRQQLKDSGLDQKITDLGSQLNDFNQTASAVDQMDLVISVDTSIAHLAGAMGKKTWVMLCHLPDWRWHLERPDSPWYPGMQLFRQPAWGDWNSLIQNVRNQLLNWKDTQ